MIKTVSDLIRELKKLDQDAPVQIAVHTAAHGEAQAQSDIMGLKFYASGVAVIDTHLPDGYAIQKRKPKY